MKADTSVDASAGHLARLVQRARPAEALLQRRQPSLFERLPPGAQARGADDEAVPTVTPAPASAMHPAEPVAAWARPSPRPEPGAVELPRQPAPVQAPLQAPRQALRVLHETLRIDASVRPVQAVSPAAQPAARQRTTEPAASLPAVGRLAALRPVDAATLPRPSRDEPHDDSMPAPPRRHGEAALPAPPRPRPLADASQPLLRPLPAPPVPRASLQPAAQRAAGAPSLRRPQAPLAPAPRELPPVQVTIGRIEVRAVAAPPAAAARSTKATPRLGLEQYLRERHGGRR